MLSAFRRIQQNPKIVTPRRQALVFGLHLCGRMLLPLARRGSRLPPLGDASRILLIRADGIGDLAMTSPLFPALRRRYPNARIDLLCSESQQSLAALFKGDLDEILPLWPERLSLREWLRLAAQLRERRYDVAADLRADFRYVLTAKASGAKRRLGFDYGGFDYLLTDALPFLGGHQSSEVAQMAEALGAPLGDSRPRLPLTDSHRRFAREWLAAQGVTPGETVIALHMSAIRPAKLWPRDRFLRLASALQREHDARILLLGAKEDRAELEAASADLPAPALISAGDLSLSEMAAVLSERRLFVGIDSGPAHLAAAVGCPTLVLFGPTDPNRYAPTGPRCVILDAPQACHARCDQAVCAAPEWHCMKTLSEEAVLAAAESLLNPAK